MPYKEHRICDPPDDPDVLIWRYVTFSRFVEMLVTHTLWFSKPKYFDDPFEGVFPDNLAQALTEEDKSYREYWGQFAGLDVMPDRLPKGAWQTNQLMCMNCWYIGTRESAAMWKIHAREGGIAIRSSFRRLTQALNVAEEDVYIGRIQYVDFETFSSGDTSNTITALMLKRLEFKHENELRAVTPVVSPSDLQNGSFDIDKQDIHKRKGLAIGVELDDLVEAVYVSPTGSESLESIVRDVASRYGLGAPIYASKLRTRPRFLAGG